MSNNPPKKDYAKQLLELPFNILKLRLTIVNVIIGILFAGISSFVIGIVCLLTLAEENHWIIITILLVLTYYFWCLFLPSLAMRRMIKSTMELRVLEVDILPHLTGFLKAMKNAHEEYRKQTLEQEEQKDKDASDK